MNQPFSSTLFKPTMPLQDNKAVNPRSKINSINVFRSLPSQNTQQPIIPPSPPPPPPPPPAPPQVQPPIISLNNPRIPKPTPPAENKESKAYLSPVIKDGPITPNEAIEKYSSLLTNYEMSEILDFPSIYYLGIKYRKIEYDRNNKCNGGFDTCQHIYKLANGDHIAYRYEVLFSLGAGAFGQVVKVLDHKTGEQIAVKIIVNTKQMETEGLVESQILNRLKSKSCPNVVQTYEHFVFRNHVCITFEILGRDLFELMQGRTYSRFLKPFSESMIRSYAFQLFQGLAGIHDAGVVHCDIKPENILVTCTSRNQIKIIDFGSGCFTGNQMYSYVQSRFFRAPEVVLGIKYGPAIDIWSAALVIIELMTGRPLFHCENEHELLWMMTELLGLPPDFIVQQSTRKKNFFDEIRGKFVLKQIPRRYFKPSSLNLMKRLDTTDFQLCDLLLRCLTWDPNQRLTAKEALKHTWLQTKSVIPSRQQPRLRTNIITQSQTTLPGLHRI